MLTILLVDDEDIFKAVEGTCLRREPCRLLKSPPDRLLERAVGDPPDLIILSHAGAAARRLLGEVCAAPQLSEIPVISIDPRPGARNAPKDLPGRSGAVEILAAPTPDDGGTAGGLDRMLDEAIKRRLPDLVRRADRVAVSLSVNVRSADGEFRVRTKNLSPSGLFLKTERVLSPGQRIEIRFRLPMAAETARRPASISGTCEVVRAVGIAGQPGAEEIDLIPGVGVRFVDLAGEGRSALNEYVEHLSRSPASRGRARRPSTRADSAH